MNFKDTLAAATEQRTKANENVKALVEREYPVGSLVVYRRHGKGREVVGRIIRHPYKSSHDDRLVIQNTETENENRVEPSYIVRKA